MACYCLPQSAEGGWRLGPVHGSAFWDLQEICLKKLSGWFEVEGLKHLASTRLGERQAILRGLWPVPEHTVWRG